jgi:hypothetical protein
MPSARGGRVTIGGCPHHQTSAALIGPLEYFPRPIKKMRRFLVPLGLCGSSGPAESLIRANLA